MTRPPATNLRGAILADPQEELPHLHQLLASYFHQDWTVERDQWTEVIDDFIAESPSGVVGRTAGELRRVLRADFDDAALQWLLDRLDCGLDPQGVGLDAQTWLSSLEQRLDG